jgi:hypothetical protein
LATAQSGNRILAMKKTIINQIFTGKSQTLPDGHATGIFKQAVTGP